MAKDLTTQQGVAARKLALMICDLNGHSHLPFGSCCAKNHEAATRLILSLIRKKLI